MASMVVCPEPPAARIGAEILTRGGNAADAAVATAFAQGVANPLLCGLSGTAALLHRDQAGRTTVLNGECAIGCGAVPQAWIDSLGGRAELIGRYIVPGDDNQIGPPSVMVLRFVACCWELFNRLGSGRLGWADLLEPAIRLARIKLAGEPPSPLDPPPGCVFNPRCPNAAEICRMTEPKLDASGGRAACHFTEFSGSAAGGIGLAACRSDDRVTPSRCRDGTAGRPVGIRLAPKWSCTMTP